ncbi:MAG TPA: class A beta-lactamase-related serine hydrolase [Sulfurovum sp.]|nr:class A beta-lactamase-related serine hydrolase [Sulfurovum sp.]
MKKEIAVGLLTILVLVGCGSDNNTVTNNLVQTNVFDKSSTDIIFNKVKKFPKNVQVSIAKIKDGNVYYYGALHGSNAVSTVENYTNTFMIGSITKVFTSTLLAQMVLSNKMALDENIGNKLSYTLNNNISMSYRQLANHTSGLPREADIDLDKDPKYNAFDQLDMTDVEKYLKYDLKLAHTQGTHLYSNLGVNILGYMMTYIENKPYETLLQERIFNKLGMKHSTTIRANAQSRLIPAVGASDIPFPLAYKSAGGIHSTVEDLYKFSLASFGDEPEYLLTQEATLKVDDTISIGLGWFIERKTELNLNFYSHSGGTHGYRSIIVLDRENQNGIIVLSNLPLEGNIGDIYNLGMELMEEMYK